MSPASQQGISILRDASQFQWYVIPFLLVVVHAYSVAIYNKRWSIVLGGLAFFGMDWFNETWNALVFHFTGYAPVWGAPAKTAYLVLIGWNIEIIFMFLLMGLSAGYLLPEDKKMKIFGIPNRILFAVVSAAACVIVEIVLNVIGVLTWDYSWWSAKFPWILFLFGYLPFFLVCYWVHDMASVKKQVVTTGCILGFDAICAVVFGFILGWI